MEKFQTKYSIGDNVYFIEDNKIVKKEIRRLVIEKHINIYARKDSPLSKIITSTKYFFNDDVNSTKFKYENECFDNWDDMMKEFAKLYKK